MNGYWMIEAIEDSRSYDWATGKMIPGSGQMLSCEHCGKGHEIHVTIYNPVTKDRMIVGSTCAKQLAFNVGKKLSTSALQYEGMKQAASEIADRMPKGLKTWDAIEAEARKYAPQASASHLYICNYYAERRYDKTS